MQRSIAIVNTCFLNAEFFLVIGLAFLLPCQWWVAAMYPTCENGLYEIRIIENHGVVFRESLNYASRCFFLEFETEKLKEIKGPTSPFHLWPASTTIDDCGNVICNYRNRVYLSNALNGELGFSSNEQELLVGNKFLVSKRTLGNAKAYQWRKFPEGMLQSFFELSDVPNGTLTPIPNSNSFLYTCASKFSENSRAPDAFSTEELVLVSLDSGFPVEVNRWLVPSALGHTFYSVVGGAIVCSSINGEYLNVHDPNSGVIYTEIRKSDLVNDTLGWDPVISFFANCWRRLAYEKLSQSKKSENIFGITLPTGGEYLLVEQLADANFTLELRDESNHTVIKKLRKRDANFRPTQFSERQSCPVISNVGISLSGRYIIWVSDHFRAQFIDRSTGSVIREIDPLKWINIQASAIFLATSVWVLVYLRFSATHKYPVWLDQLLITLLGMLFLWERMYSSGNPLSQWRMAWIGIVAIWTSFAIVTLLETVERKNYWLTFAAIVILFSVTFAIAGLAGEFAIEMRLQATMTSLFLLSGFVFANQQVRNSICVRMIEGVSLRISLRLLMVVIGLVAVLLAASQVIASCEFDYYSHGSAIENILHSLLLALSTLIATFTLKRYWRSRNHYFTCIILLCCLLSTCYCLQLTHAEPTTTTALLD